MSWVTVVTLCLLSGYQSFAAEPYFMIINDIHYDPTYWTTQESCNKPIPKDELGPYGHFECDAPWELVDLAIDGMENLQNNEGQPQFVVWLGDNAHHPLNYSNSILDSDMMLTILTNLTNKLQSKDNGSDRGWQVLPVLGNHDWYPTNQLPPEPNARYDELAELWKQWLSTEAQETFKKGGYYTMDVDSQSGIRAVVMNTNLYLPGNRLVDGLEDPAGQWEWLENILQDAVQNQERLFIFTHIPSGVSETDETYKNFRPEHADRFNNLIRNYSSVIISLHAVHVHTDSFRMFYKDGEPVATEFISPALVPWRCRVCDPLVVSPRNPALRTVIYDTESKKIEDMHQYYFHLPPAGYSKVPEWLLEYRFRNYGISDKIEPANMHKVLESFKDRGSETFHQYYSRNTVNVTTDVTTGVGITCGCECKQRHLCALEFVDYDENAECIEKGFVTCGASSLFTSIFLLAICIIHSMW